MNKTMKTKKRVAHNKGKKETAEQKLAKSLRMKAYFASPAGIAARKKKSEEKKKYFASPEGKRQSKKHSKRMQGNQHGLGKVRTEECKAKHSKKVSGKNNPFYGKHHTEKFKKEQSINRIEYCATNDIEAWNAGLTKETDERVKRNGESTSKGRIEMFQTEVGKQLKKILSDKNKEYYKTHDGYWKGKEIPQETCDKISATLTGQIFTKERCEKISLSTKGIKKTKEHKKNISKGLTKFFKSEDGIKSRKIISQKVSAWLSTPEGLDHLERIFNNNFKPSSYEERAMKFLDKFKIDYEQQYCIRSKELNKNKFFDLYLNDYNILVEIDSDYWHSSKERKMNDKLKDRLAKENGMQLIRIPEKELLNNKYKITILRAVNQPFLN